MFDLDENFIKEWSSTRDAARWIQSLKPDGRKSLSGIVSHISEVCNKKRKTAYSYKWKFQNVDLNQEL